MTGRLERRLGLYSVFSISIGAMIGSGIFVLPGLAAELSGPAVILAYLLAGLIVIPAALAQSEMATAVPRAGGAYLYIDLAMGPLMGTVAGVGVWFSLVFKAAFALDGLGAYLSIFTDFPSEVLALTIGALLLVVNLIGVKQSGAIQAVLVTWVFGVLIVFIGAGAIEVEASRFHPFFVADFSSLLKTTGVVFVSYAGVTKVASVAEEVHRPARTLPVAIMSSLMVMLFMYPAVVYVMVGVTPTGLFLGDTTPMATSVEQFLPSTAVTVVSVTAVLALASMANAGLLASSRYPFAMARRRLAPPIFAKIGTRSNAPTAALVLTGGTLIALVAFLPILELAKLASAFQLLVLALVNVALIAFRSSGLWWYKPRFHAPGYPWVQIFGIVASLVLITEIGAEALIGAVAIIAGAVLWYQFYGRSRAIKESAVREGVRQRTMSRLVAWTQTMLREGAHHVVVVSENDSDDRVLLRLAGSLIEGEEQIDVIRAAAHGDLLAEHLTSREAGLVVIKVPDDDPRVEHAVPEGYDVVALTGGVPESIGTIAVLGSGGPFDVSKISLAARLARSEHAGIRFVHVLDPNATRAQMRAIERYHAEVGQLCTVPTRSVVTQSEDLIPALVKAAEGADLVIVGAPLEHRFLSDLSDRIVKALDRPVLLVGTTKSLERGPLSRAWTWVGRMVKGSDATDTTPLLPPPA